VTEKARDITGLLLPSPMERFNLKNQNSVEVKVHYQVKISNKSVAFENIG
jgi:hypothetical protein